jgi:hypothetical protein
MRRSDSRRHPFFEWTVFGLALVLGAILLFHGARRFLAGRTADGPPRATGPLAPLVPLEGAPAGPATESSVTALPPVRLTSTGGQRRWKAEVPAPPSAAKPKK